MPVWVCVCGLCVCVCGMFVYDLHFMTLLLPYAKYSSVYRVSHKNHLPTGCTLIYIYLPTVGPMKKHLPESSYASSYTGCPKKCIFPQDVPRNASSYTGCPRNASSYRKYQEMRRPILGVLRYESSCRVHHTGCSRMCINQHNTVLVQTLHSMSACVNFMNIYACKSHTLYLIHHTTLTIKPSSNNSIPASFFYSHPTFINSFIYLFIYKYINLTPYISYIILH